LFDSRDGLTGDVSPRCDLLRSQPPQLSPRGQLPTNVFGRLLSLERRLPSLVPRWAWIHRHEAAGASAKIPVHAARCCLWECVVNSGGEWIDIVGVGTG